MLNPCFNCSPLISFINDVKANAGKEIVKTTFVNILDAAEFKISFFLKKKPNNIIDTDENIAPKIALSVSVFLIISNIFFLLINFSFVMFISSSLQYSLYKHRLISTIYLNY